MRLNINISDILDAISVSEIVAPPILVEGGSADIDCQWGLGSGETLFSLKWYFGLDEIYRYCIH